MKKWFKSKEGRKITVIVTILCVVLSLQIAAFVLFNKKIYDVSLEHLTQQVEEISVYVEKNFQIELNQYIYTLQSTELHLEKENLYLPRILEIIQEMQELSDFKMAGISNLRGIGVDSDGEVYNISHHLIKENFQNNDVYISNVLKSNYESLIFIAVPLKIDGEPVGILWGKVSLSDIVKNIEFANDSYKYFQLVDNHGNYLSPSNNRYALNNRENNNKKTIWEELKNYNYPHGETVEEIYESIQKKESGSFYFEIDGQGRYVSYRPLKINNWYLFSVQIQDELHSYVNHTRKHAVHLLLFIAVGLLIIFISIYRLIYGMYKNMVKQNQEMQTINTMMQATLKQIKHIPFTIDYKLKQIMLYGISSDNLIKYKTFEEISPETILKRNLLDNQNFKIYQKLYIHLIVQRKKCPPVVLNIKIQDKSEWIRINIISHSQDSNEQVIGILENYNEQKEKDIQIKSHLNDIKKIEQKSQLDFLTNLYNRETFIEKTELLLKECKAQNQTGAFLILDLDHFKEVNDCMGHGMGDVVLQNTAAVLLKTFGKDGLTGRLGGDEFVVFVKDIQNLSAFEKRIKRLNRILYKLYCKDNYAIRTSASIGIALTPKQSTSFKTLYEKADRALYKVKQSGKNGYSISAR